MIPAGWTTKRFADIADYKTGRTPARANPEYWVGTEDGVPWVAISDMTEFGTVTETKEKITKTAFDQIFRGQAVRAGTLIMSFKLTIGRVATLGIDACHNEAIISIYPKPGIDQRYLGYFLAQVDYDALQDRQVKGNTLNQEKIDRIEVWLPPFDQQSSISDVLDLLKRALELQDRAFATCQDLKRGAMRTLFTRGLRGEAQKETEFGSVPETWETVPLDQCAEVQTGAAKGRRFSDAETVEVPYLRVANVQDGHLDLSDMKEIRIRKSEIERYRLCVGDVVLTEGGDFDKLGRGFIWRGELDLCVHQNHVFAVRTYRNRLLPEFFAYLVQSTYGKAYFLKVAHKTTNLACINSTKLKAFPALIPPTLDEQREIISILDAIDRKIDLHHRKRAILDELFRTLLHKLMTGEIRVANLDLSAINRSAPVAGVAA
jgi:type I restriction enzyme S subunit